MKRVKKRASPTSTWLGGGLLGPQGVAQKGQNDDDPGKAGHHQQQGGHQGQQQGDQQRLQHPEGRPRAVAGAQVHRYRGGVGRHRAADRQRHGKGQREEQPALQPPQLLFFAGDLVIHPAPSHPPAPAFCRSIPGGRTGGRWKTPSPPRPPASGPPPGSPRGPAPRWG